MSSPRVARVRGRRTAVGAVLAGGLGRRIGGDKALVELAGQPLIKYPLRALSEVVDEVAIVAKAGSALPSMPGVSVWLEPNSPRHPIVGILEALALADGRPVLTLAADMPFVPPAALRRLLAVDAELAGPARAIVAVCEGRLQPFPGLYRAEASVLLARALRAGGDDGAGARVVEAVAALDPVLVELSDPEVFFSVNAPEDLLAAAAILDLRAAGDGDQPKVKS